MPFIGNQPALSYTSFAKQDFTTSATTSYTLSQPVANENEIALFINFVRQEPTTAYTASGTSLTLTSATSASDDMYAIFLGKAVQTVNPPAGSVGLSQLSATGTKDATTFLRGDNSFAEAGNLIKLTSTTISSNTSNIDFEDVFTSDYDIYKLFLTNVRPDTDQSIYLRFLTTGTTQLSSAEYNMLMTGRVHRYSTNASSETTDVQKNATQFQVTLWGNVESDTSEGGLNAEITFLNPRQSTYKFITSDMMYFYTGGDYIVKDNTGVYIKNTSVMSGINIQPSSSNIASGILTLYGVKK